MRIKQEVVTFYKNLYIDDGLVSGKTSMGNAFLCFGAKWEDLLCKEVSKQEVHDALFDMAPLKASGIDGLHAQFYQSQWNTIGDSLFSMVKKGFENGEIEPFLNKTLLVLIPKVKRPKVVTQFRPISLCTVPYKVLSEVIVNRLKPLMPILVVENQTSFVRGRHITDNVIIAQEVVHTMRIRKGKTGWMTLKFDMEKAYDRLR